MVVASLLAGIWLLLRWAAVRDRLAAQAPAILAAAGLAWWLWAPWAWLGWIGVGLAIWLAVGSPWKRRPASFSPRAAG
jgi:hypothetical protein